MSPAAPDLARQRERRREIVDAARRLLGERDWHDIGIDQIGAEAGLTGPAVYRYFSGKQAVLTAALAEATEALWGDLPPDGPVPLEELVASHVRFALADADVIELWYREARLLPAADRAAQRRLQRRYLERWVDALVERRPELDRGQGRAMVQAAVSLIHSVAHYEEHVAAGRLAVLLERMALAALSA